MHLSEALITHLALAFAIVSAFLRLTRSAAVFAVLAFLFALWFRQINWLGALMISGAGLALLIYVKFSCVPVRALAFVGFVTVALLGGISGVHVLPGISNPVVLDSVRFAEDSVPFTMYLNVDKAFIGFFIIFLLLPSQALTLNRPALRKTAFILGALIAVLMPTALLIKYVRFDPKFPESSWIWAANNLLFVCVPEGGFYRGLIQGGLRRKFPNLGFAAVLLSASLFGLSHFQGGMAYVGLATIAGIFYGFAYDRTGSLLSAVLVHFLLNCVHFFLFSYPAIDPSSLR
jgi:uncharacterized protein